MNFCASRASFALRRGTGQGGAGPFDDHGKQLPGRESQPPYHPAMMALLLYAYAELAARMGTSQSTIVRLESGQTLPSARTRLRYAEAAGTKFDVRLSAA